MKATQLEKIRGDYEVITGQVDIMHSLLKKRKETLKLMETKVEELEAEYNDLKKLRSLEKDITNLKDKLAWALIQEKEKQKEELDLKEAKHIERKERVASNINKIKVRK